MDRQSLSNVETRKGQVIPVSVPVQQWLSSLLSMAFVSFIPERKGRCCRWLVKCKVFLDQPWATSLTRHSWDFPNLLRIIAPMGRERDQKTSLSYRKTQNNILGISGNIYDHCTAQKINPGLTGLSRDYWQIYTWAWVSCASARLCAPSPVSLYVCLSGQMTEQRLVRTSVPSLRAPFSGPL